MTLAVVAPLAGSANATVVAPPTARDGRLTQVGPIAEIGFPSWYRDSTGLRLEPCTTMEDPLCAVLPDEVPNPDLPVSYPDNFPGEFFYQLADATLTLTDGTKAVIGLNVEGAWANGAVIDGDQMVFGRVRIRFAAAAGRRFRITHPYGIDDLTADDKGVRMTEDVGTVPGAFGGVLNGRVGPFLRWDPAVAPAAPAGYTGDPGVDHKVVGSPYDTNFVRIEELDPRTGAVLGQVGFTDTFSIQGRYASNAGVDVDQATFTTGADGNGVVEVYATSEPGQAVEIAANPALGIRATRLNGQNGHYYGRFALTGPLPAGATVDIVNASDRPVARKTRKLIDVVQVTKAAYDADAHTLTVAATSSDQDAAPGVLSVTGYGPITGQPFTNVLAPPVTVTVTSSSGGTATASLLGSGAVLGPEPPVAAATADATAVVGQTVQLDGTGSTGEVDSYRWTQTAGPEVIVTGGTTASASFVAPSPGTYAFTLTLTGPGGQQTSEPVTVTVVAAAKPVAEAGPDRTIQRGKAVTLDGSASSGVETYSWKQVSGPAVTLAGASAAKPAFTFPAQALPASPGPNASFVYDNDPVVFELTVTNPNGTATDRVTIRPQAETFPGGVTVRYRTGNNEWRISGTSSLLAGQRITAVLGDTLTGRVIGTSPVDAAGAFSIRVTGPAPGTVRTISVVTTVGGRQLAVPVTVTN
ncbi:PKD domain-containing protein [Actinoplanes sp. NPDC020271]|uniref:PKD domain-containing protein n=1 Tax=Actinoplanes sp. NPDC020271 TaxID=3363896 RepID=UPI0037AE3AC1